MALCSIKELLAHAAEGEYTIGAFNVCNMDTLGAVLAAARQERSPVILQMSVGAVCVLAANGESMRDAAEGQ